MRAPAAVLGLLAALAILATATPVTAADGDLLVQADAPADPVKPLAGPANVTGEVHIPCRLLNEAGSGTASVVHLAVTGPEWADATVVPSRSMVGHRDACTPSGYAIAPFRLAVGFDATARALAPQPFTVNATLIGGTENATGTHRLDVQPGYYSILNVHAAESTVQAPPGSTVNVPVTVQNHGNGDTRVRFEVTQAPEGWSVVAPPYLTLGTRAGGGDAALAEATVILAIHIPRDTGYVNQAQSITFTTNGTYAYQPGLASDNSTTTLVVNVKGMGAPGPAAGLVAGGLALAALALRRRLP